MTYTRADELNSAEHIHSPEYSQPLCTVLQVALVELLQSFGVAPAAVVGHSSGEIAAAYTIGALSHESACKAAYWRGQLAGKLRATTIAAPGAMMAVNLPAGDIAAWLARLDSEHDGAVHTACVNSPNNVTLSGPSAAIDALAVLLKAAGVLATKVNTGVAYHSPAMRAIAAEYLERMGTLAPRAEADAAPATMVSSVTGQAVARKLLSSPQYWVDNLVSPVRFADAVRLSVSTSLSLPLPLGVDAVADVVEIGPHAALRRAVRESAPGLRYHAALLRNQAPLQTLLELVGELFCHGHVSAGAAAAANMQAAQQLPFLTDCPPYPFDHGRRYWAESRLSRDYRLRPRAQGFLLGRRAHDWNPLQPRWRNWLSVETTPWLGHHVVSLTPIASQ